MTLAGHELGLGPGAEPPEVQGFWAINNCQMSMILYLSCDTGRSRFVVGSGGEAPRSSGVLYVKLSSDEHILNLICDTGRSRINLGSRGRNPRKFRGFGQ